MALYGSGSMPQSARTKRWQRTIDSIIGGIIVLIGVTELARFIIHPTQHHPALAIIWAALLTGTGVAVVVGSILRTVKPGHKQSIGFQFELGGWGGSACLIFWYAIVGFMHDHDQALLLALLLIVVMLVATFFRLVAAMREGHRRVVDS